MATSAVSMEPPGLGTKKTFFVLVVVVGCIAILWPKVFYPMMFNGQSNKNLIKEHRTGAGCCDVVLDQQKFANVSQPYTINQPGFRKRLNLISGEYSIRQERPPHLRADGIHPAMRERGRAIPTTPTVPIVTSKPIVPPAAPRIVEGRPGPIPGMRPPMGAGSTHQATQKGNSMGFIMPLYTIGIVAFFVYTIMKLVFKKSNIPYATESIKPNPDFAKQVFGQDKCGSAITNLGWSTNNSNNNSSTTIIGHNSIETNGNVHKGFVGDVSLTNHHQQGTTIDDSELAFKLRETEQLLEISLLKKKLLETEKAMSKIIANMAHVPKAQDATEMNGSIESQILTNGHAIVTNLVENILDKANEQIIINKNVQKQIETNNHITSSDDKLNNENGHQKLQQHHQNNDHHHKKKDTDRSVKILGMEMTTSCEGGQKWPGNSMLLQENHHEEESQPETQSIFLEGSLPHESQILVSDSETKTEEIYDEDNSGSDEEPAVILSSKMTLSLINLDPIDKNSTQKDDIDEMAEIEIDEDDEDADDEDIEDLEDDDNEININGNSIQNGVGN